MKASRASGDGVQIHSGYQSGFALYAGAATEAGTGFCGFQLEQHGLTHILLGVCNGSGILVSGKVGGIE